MAPKRGDTLALDLDLAVQSIDRTFEELNFATGTANSVGLHPVLTLQQGYICFELGILMLERGNPLALARHGVLEG